MIGHFAHFHFRAHTAVFQHSLEHLHRGKGVGRVHGLALQVVLVHQDGLANSIVFLSGCQNVLAIALGCVRGRANPNLIGRQRW